ncbi:SMI1/KNR4 family protein [Micromonospora sp. DT63]|uniref:SMI1/KNR4 family protein n=1 Tax=Micromonospora sp. DT63 TaxID=3393441 RepID=UPI003CE948A5
MLDPTIVFDTSGPLESPLTEEVLREVEAQLGRKLPAAYVDLVQRHNGGGLARDAHPAPNRTSWSTDHVAVYTDRRREHPDPSRFHRILQVLDATICRVNIDAAEAIQGKVRESSVPNSSEQPRTDRGLMRGLGRGVDAGSRGRAQR